VAAGTLGLDINTVALTRGTGVFDSVKPLVLFLLAGFTPLGRVGKPFRVKEGLFAGRPYEHLAAVNALDGEVLVLLFF
jgi:hypothetical protein